MSQVLLIGIGGLDADLLRVYGPSLPNLRRLMLESPFLELASTIPPEPVPAWTSVYTGLNPANHGMLASMDCLERSVPDVDLFQEELFWEKAARAGKRVCVLNPLLSTTQTFAGLKLIPATPYPGLADQCGTTQGLSETFPALLDEPLIPPASQLTGFCETLRQRTEKQAMAGLELLKSEHWDLFYIQLDALDHVEHFLWRYSDPGDPMYPGKNEHANRILEFYQLFDKLVGRFRAAISERECVLGIVSSHGHERRCVYRLHVNEWLREQKFLNSLNQSTLQKKHMPEKSQRLSELWTWLAQLLSWNKNATDKRHCIDTEHTVAQLVELANSTSSYGGITINRALLEREQRSYELVCEAILTGLTQLCSRENPIVAWARKREECYQGKYLERYPDILFELRGDFGVGRSLNTPLIIPDSTHRLISGTHSSHGVFLLENWPAELEIYEDFQHPSVMDVAPTILHLLGIQHAPLDGQALVRPCPVRQLI